MREQSYRGLCEALDAISGSVYSVRVFGPNNKLANSLVSGRLNKVLARLVETTFPADQQNIPMSSTISNGTTVSIPTGASVSYSVLSGGVIELRLPDGGRAVFTPKTGPD